MRSPTLLLLFACMAMAADPPQRTSGHYQVTLRVPEAGLFAGEEMEIEFRVTDTARPDPVTGFAPAIRAFPEATIDMPAMPGMPKFSAIAHPEGVPGDYGIHPSFAHGGEYRLRILVRPPGGEPFTVEFPLAVGDAVVNRKTSPRFRLDVSPQPKSPHAGQPVELQLTVRDRDNSAVRNFEIVHEALMHLVIVRRDLSGFAHEHPVIAPDGTFRLSYTFTSGGEYRLFADLAPKGFGSQIASAQLKVDGNRGAAFNLRTALSNRSQKAGDTVVELVPHENPLRVGKTVPVSFALRDARTGETVIDLQPYLGVAGHLMLIHEDAATFVHSHPTGESSLEFLARFPKPGLYRGWLQFRRAGEVRTADFIFRAEGQ